VDKDSAGGILPGMKKNVAYKFARNGAGRGAFGMSRKASAVGKICFVNSL
jgi:hypothetical protein